MTMKAKVEITDETTGRPLHMGTEFSIDEEQRQNISRFLNAMRKPESSADDEVAAMAAVSAALDGLDVHARHRILEWARRRFDFDSGGVLELVNHYAQAVTSREQEVDAAAKQVEARENKATMRERDIERRRRRLESDPDAGNPLADDPSA